jgi:hypothetical protein
MRNVYKILVKNLNGTGHLEKLVMDVRTILKWIGC